MVVKSFTKRVKHLEEQSFFPTSARNRSSQIYYLILFSIRIYLTGIEIGDNSEQKTSFKTTIKFYSNKNNI